MSLAGGYPGKEQNFVISLHSSKAVMVEEVHTSGNPKYKFAYADAVIQLAVGQGRKEGVRPNKKKVCFRSENFR